MFRCLKNKSAKAKVSVAEKRPAHRAGPLQHPPLSTPLQGRSKPIRYSAGEHWEQLVLLAARVYCCAA